MRRAAAVLAIVALMLSACGGDEGTAIAEQDCDTLIRTAGRSLADTGGKGGEYRRTIDAVLRRAKKLDCPSYVESIVDGIPPDLADDLDRATNE